MSASSGQGRRASCWLRNWSRQGKRVLLLESGGALEKSAIQQLNACIYTGQPHQGAHIGRFRALGGTTTTWGGQVLEMKEQDFDGRPWVPGSGWPFSKVCIASVLQRALKPERSVGCDSQTTSEVWRRDGSDGRPTSAMPRALFYTLVSGAELRPSLPRHAGIAQYLRSLCMQQRPRIILDAAGDAYPVVFAARHLAGLDHSFPAARYVLVSGH